MRIEKMGDELLRSIFLEQVRTNNILAEILLEIKKNNSMKVLPPGFTWQTYGTGDPPPSVPYVF